MFMAQALGILLVEQAQWSLGHFLWWLERPWLWF
jgi:hypothetical protein